MSRHILTKLFMACAVCLIALSCGSHKTEIGAYKDPTGKLFAEVVVSATCVTNPDLNVYIDNTGSMDAFMADGSTLKDAVYDYVSSLTEYTNAVNLNYINNKVIPYNGELKAFIKDLNPVSFRQRGGSRANTDISEMISTVLNSVNDSTVAIFISDGIVDLPVKDTKNYLNNSQITIRNAIAACKKNNPDFGVEILNLSTPCTGNYYFPNGTVARMENVDRPYYIWIFGDKGTLAYLNGKSPTEDLAKYDPQQRLEKIAFAQESSIHYIITNLNLTNGVLNPVNGYYKATIRADFSNTLQPEGIITDPASFKFGNPNIIVESVRQITAKGSAYSHVINISIPENAGITEGSLSFFAPSLPSWVWDTNDETGTADPASGMTPGIGNLIQGVADAYKNDEILTNIKFIIK